LAKDNQPVKYGDVLFRIDPDRFELAQADAADGRGAARIGAERAVD